MVAPQTSARKFMARVEQGQHPGRHRLDLVDDQNAAAQGLEAAMQVVRPSNRVFSSWTRVVDNDW